MFAAAYFLGAAWLFAAWLGDLRHFAKAGSARGGAFEGATTVSARYTAAGVAAALALLALHSIIEASLGFDSDQSRVGVWALLSWTAAAFVEELIFRGYLSVRGRGKFLLCLSAAFFSAAFALAHPFMWDYSVPEGASIFAGSWKFDFSPRAVFATAAVFDCSALFYILRFLPQNRRSSILPCIAAHCAYNLGVFAIKAATGFVSL